MAKDDLKLKDLFTRLVNWIKGKFSEQDAKIAANKYTSATDSTEGLVKIVTAIGEQDSAIVPTKKYIEAYLLDYDRQIGAHEDLIRKKADKSELSDYAKTSVLSNYATTVALTSLQSTVNGKADRSDLNPATASKDGLVKLLDNENSVLYPDYKGTAAGVSHVDNVIKSMEVGMAAQLNLKQDKIKIVTTEPTASSTVNDPEGTIYFKV